MTLMRYILYVRQEVDMAAVQATVRAIDARAGETVMSMAEKLIAQGEAKGLSAAQKLIAEGEAKGRVEGEAKGRVDGRAEVLLKRLRLRFASVPDGAAERVMHADAATLDRWVERVLTAGSVDDVLAD